MRAPFRVLGVAVVGLVLAAAPASSQMGLPEVRDVRFEGNRSFSSDSLAWAIVTRETECRSLFLAPLCAVNADLAVQRHYLRPSSVPLDQLRLTVFYQRRGYREVRVDTATIARPDGGVDVLFRIAEGRPVLVDSIEFLGAEPFEGEHLLEDLPIRVGDPLSDLLLEATQDTLRRRLRNRGYAHADVLKSLFIPAETPYQARVSYDIAPGPRSRYGHVDVQILGDEGRTPSLSTSTVLKMLQFRTGDLYRAEQILGAQARLYGLEIVRSARVEAILNPGDTLPGVAGASAGGALIPPGGAFAALDSVIPVRVRVQEGAPHRVRTGAGWNSAECFDAEARWVSRNFGGGARRLQVRGRLANLGAPQFHDILCQDLRRAPFYDLNWLAAVDFSQPWVFSTRNSFSASVYGERQSLPDAFVRQAFGVSLTLTRSIGPRTPLSLSYNPELSSLEAAEVLFCTSFLVCTPEDIRSLKGANWLSPVRLNFTRNRSNNILNPSRGYTLVLDVEHAAPWTRSDFRYDRVIADGAAYRRAGPGLILAGRLRAGWVGAGAFEDFLGIDERADVKGVHPQKRFYGGGANSVRGVAQSRLGPTVLRADLDRLLAPPSDGGAGCTPAEVLTLTCDANPIRDSGFLPRPTGGTRVLEGSVEARFRVSSRVQGATFLDFGQVWADGEDATFESLEFTPGAGFRYLSPIGPIRVDVAYSFQGGRRLPVVTQQLRPFESGQDREEDRIRVGDDPIPFIETKELVVLGPKVLYGRSSAFSLSRFQVHISIGQAF